MLNDNTVNAVQKMLKNAQKQMDCKNLYQGKDSIFKSIGAFHLFKYSTMVVCIVEAATRGVPLEKVFLEISQNWLENNCVRVTFLIKLQALARHKCFLLIFVKCLRTPYRTPLGDCFWHWVPTSTYGYDEGEVYLWTLFLMAQLRSIQKNPDILNLKLCSCEDQSEFFASTATFTWCWLWDKSYKAFAFCFYMLNRRKNPVVYSLIKEN